MLNIFLTLRFSGMEILKKLECIESETFVCCDNLKKVKVQANCVIEDAFLFECIILKY